MQIVSKFSTHIVKVPSSVLEVVPWHHLDNHFGVLDSMEASLHWSDSGDIFHSYPCDKIDFEQIPILPRSYLQPSLFK